MNIIGEYDGVVIAALGFDEVARLERSAAVDDDVILDYKHVAQNGIDADANSSDCGAACVAVCARGNGWPDVTVDEVAERFMQLDKPTMIVEVRAALGGYGMANRHQRPLIPVDIAQNIRDHRLPVIALVSYRALPHQVIDYPYSHYIVIYGVYGTGDFLYHDPLSDGRLLTITESELTMALDNIRTEGNMPRQGIVLI